jgi:hypothetical protein
VRRGGKGSAVLSCCDSRVQLLTPSQPVHTFSTASPPARTLLQRAPLSAYLCGAAPTPAPKAARAEYEGYLQAVGGLLGGDASSEELQEAGTQVG